MEEPDGPGLWAVLERAVLRRDPRAFRACIEVTAGFVGADLGVVSVDAAERPRLAMIMGEGSGVFGEASAEAVLHRLEPLVGEVVVEDTSLDPRFASGPGVVRALVAGPLRDAAGARLGGFLIGHREPRTFSAGERALVGVARAFIESNLELALVSIRLGLATRRLSDERERLLHAQATRRTAAELLVHDLKNPLAVINVTAELARAAAGPDTAGMIDEILESTAIARRLVNDLLDVAHAERGRLRAEHQPVDLRLLAERLMTRLRPLADQRQQTFALRCEVESPVVIGDSFLLERLLRNLADNALKYAPPSSTITFGVAEHSGRLRLSVQDEGVSVPEALRALIFEQDTRTLSTLRGSYGLGLRLCKVVAELHDAEISVEPAGPSGGNVFFVDLPRAEPGVSPDAGERRGAPRSPRRPR